MTYDTASLPTNTLICEKPQTFEILKMETRGYQLSPFNNLDKELPIEAWCEGTYLVGWGLIWAEYQVNNVDLGLDIRIGGNSQQGVVSFIERYGFYEGGKGTNELRIGC